MCQHDLTGHIYVQRLVFAMNILTTSPTNVHQLPAQGTLH
jgi:hypothetical protein